MHSYIVKAFVPIILHIFGLLYIAALPLKRKGDQLDGLVSDGRKDPLPLFVLLLQNSCSTLFDQHGCRCDLRRLACEPLHPVQFIVIAFYLCAVQHLMLWYAVAARYHMDCVPVPIVRAVSIAQCFTHCVGSPPVVASSSYLFLMRLVCWSVCMLI